MAGVVTPKKRKEPNTSTPTTPVVNYTPSNTSLMNTLFTSQLDTISTYIQAESKTQFDHDIKQILNPLDLKKLTTISTDSKYGIVFKYTNTQDILNLATNDKPSSYIFKVCFIKNERGFVKSSNASNKPLVKQVTSAENFRREAEIQSAIYAENKEPNNIVPPITAYGILDHNHPFIHLLSLNKDNRILNIMQQDTHKYGIICMPYLEGYYTLSTIEQKCKEANMYDFFSYYVNLSRLALVILYSLGYYQGDENMDNIMINPYITGWLGKDLPGRPMIIDFGRAINHSNIKENPKSILDTLCTQYTKYKRENLNQSWICKDYNIEQFMLFCNIYIHYNPDIIPKFSKFIELYKTNKTNMYQLNIKNKLKISIPPVHGIFIEKPKKPKFNGGTKKTKTKTKTKKTRIIYKK
jgi:hypothetical protein